MRMQFQVRARATHDETEAALRALPWVYDIIKTSGTSITYADVWLPVGDLQTAITMVRLIDVDLAIRHERIGVLKVRGEDGPWQKVLLNLPTHREPDVETCEHRVIFAIDGPPTCTRCATVLA